MMGVLHYSDDNYIHKIDGITGTELASCELPDYVGTWNNLVYGPDGRIYYINTYYYASVSYAVDNPAARGLWASIDPDLVGPWLYGPPLTPAAADLLDGAGPWAVKTGGYGARSAYFFDWVGMICVTGHGSYDGYYYVRFPTYLADTSFEVVHHIPVDNAGAGLRGMSSDGRYIVTTDDLKVWLYDGATVTSEVIYRPPEGFGFDHWSPQFWRFYQPVRRAKDGLVYAAGRDDAQANPAEFQDEYHGVWRFRDGGELEQLYYAQNILHEDGGVGGIVYAYGCGRIIEPYYYFLHYSKNGPIGAANSPCIARFNLDTNVLERTWLPVDGYLLVGDSASNAPQLYGGVRTTQRWFDPGH